MNNFINLINKNSFLKNIFQKKNNIKIFKIITLSINSILLVWLHFSVFGWHFSTKTKKQNLQKYSKTLKVAMTNSSIPNTFKATNQKNAIKATNGEYIAGFDIDLIKDVAERLEYNLEIHVFDFAGVLTSLEQGTVDLAITTLSITDQRKENFIVSKAYTQTSTSMVVRKKDDRFKEIVENKKIEYKEFCQKLKEKGAPQKPIKFVTVTSTAAIKMIEDEITNKDDIKSHVKKNNELTSPPACFQDVLQGKSDIFVIDSYLARCACQKEDDLVYFDMTSDDSKYSVCPQGLGIFLPKGEKEIRSLKLKEKMDKILCDLKLVTKDENQSLQDIIDLKEKRKNLTKDNDKYKQIDNQIKKIESESEARLKTVFDNHKDMLSKSTTWHQIKETFPSYLEGLKTTLILAIDGLIIGFLFATSYTLIKNSQSHNKIILNINKGTTYFLDTLFFILKGIPVAAQAMLVFYGIGYLCKDLFEIKRLYAGLFVLVLNSLANITVILMQNIKFLDKGQIEAAHSLGMNQKQVFFSIIFPQALKRSVPFIIQQFITNIKDSSFFAIIGIAELSWQAQSNMGSTFNPILPFVTISCFYLIIISITNLLNKIFTKNILHK
ncbi:transporter substrate-binding domain-containing protein ['Catharanthus roseus' aster yellows phytoplasma]|uniref:Transporter substrate-binding domain-containing protein n=1 Tax='Catharanthus roseus' aster yellows phytoplasma TaxID=1193712 RepID=A0A4P6MAG4_9MOLU|nr:transporter substrate-binding domain-containing protein ['Catharanthus roseus' aster yellows phytoplasma]